MGARPAQRGLTAAVVAGTALLATAPLVLLLVTSVGRGWFWPRLLPPEWTLRAWQYLASPRSGVIGALTTSLELAAAVSITSVVLALPAARALALHQFAGRRVLLFVLLLPILAPPLAAAMGLHAVFIRIGLIDSRAGVFLVHLVPAVPYATLMLVGSFANFDADFEAQARTLGASTWAIWTRVTLPSIAPGVAVAAVFSFLISWTQYLLTLLIGGGRVLTLPVILVGFVRGGDEAVGAALSILFIAPTLLLFAGIARFLRTNP